ncbi:MAG: alpha/beta hydrolase, partial [Sphingomonadales bacterium]
MTELKPEAKGARRLLPPPGGRMDGFDRPDGMHIRVAAWPADTDRPRGTVVLLHGWREFTEKYYETIADLRDRGFAVVTMDWRGQGLSGRIAPDRRRGYSRSFDDNVADVAALVEWARAPDRMPGPLLLMAHSMGGHVAFRVLHDYPGLFDRAVILAPMMGIDLGPMPGPMPECAARLLVRAAVRLGAGERYAPFQRSFSEARRLRENRRFLTSDPDRANDELVFYRDNPDLILNGLTWGWLKAAFGSMDVVRAPGYAQAIATPVFAVLAGADRVVSNGEARRFIARLPHARHAVIEGARHEI